MKWLQFQTPEQLQPATALPYVNNFQFNDATSVSERWKVALTATIEDGMLQLQIPAFIPTEKMAAPAWTKHVECTVAAASCNCKDSIGNGSSVHVFTIPYNKRENAAQTIQLPVAMPPGSLVVAAVSLTYYVTKNGKQMATDNVAFMPAGIVEAMYV